MSEPLTDKEIAELREDIKTGYGDAAEWIAALLDEVEKSRKLATEEDALWTSVHELLMYLLVTENLSPPARRRVERMAAIVAPRRDSASA